MDYAEAYAPSIKDETSLYLIGYISLLAWTEIINGVTLSDEKPLKDLTKPGLFTFSYYVALATRTVLVAIFTQDPLFVLLTLLPSGMIASIFNRICGLGSYFHSCFMNFLAPVITLAILNSWLVVYQFHRKGPVFTVSQLYLNSLLISLILLKYIGFILGKLWSSLNVVIVKLVSLIQTASSLSILAMQLHYIYVNFSPEESLEKLLEVVLPCATLTATSIGAVILWRLAWFPVKFSEFGAHVVSFLMPDVNLFFGVCLWTGLEGFAVVSVLVSGVQVLLGAGVRLLVALAASYSCTCTIGARSRVYKVGARSRVYKVGTEHRRTIQECTDPEAARPSVVRISCTPVETYL